MRKPFLIIVTLIIIILGLSFARSIISNSMSTSGSMLSDIQEQSQTYELENSIMREKIFSYSSLTSVASVAAKLGFVDHKNVVSFSEKMPIAVRQ